jgi:tetratricopeptide (TPR) repeat protein
MTGPSVAEEASLDSLVARVADEFQERQKRGERPDVEEYATRHPQAAALLRKVLASLQVLNLSLPGNAADSDEASLTGTLGDFRLLREVGRGGMGVVYEAEQLSLGRRVALKVLPLAGALDPRHLQRFQNEARAAACLHHPTIAPVYAVGCERGVHYYAMQFIDGLTLAQVLDRQRPASESPQPNEPTTAYTPPPAAAETDAQARAATDWAPRDAAYLQRVAEWGIQAAEALEHAHQVGIVHRDIKPGNLMVDGQGKLWVTDFGLARMGADSGLTLTGDLVGTLRYMSPEQALAKRVVIDHRTDLYSLGVTLYELLSGRPAVEGNTREEILRKLTFEEPPSLRRWNRSIPAELETIVLKAMEKNPADRYATAQELADDLRNFQEDRPIRARRPSLAQRARRWARRHRAAVTATVLCLGMALAAAVGSVGWVLGERASRQEAAEAKVREALEEGGRRLQEGNPYDPVLITMVQQAQARVDAGAVGPELQGRVRQLRRDLDMLQRLEEARLQATAPGKEGWDWTGADRLYAEAFQEYGLDVIFPDPAKTAEQVRTSAIHTHLVAALDDWGLVRNRLHKGSGASLAAVAERADDDSWRQGLRRAVARGDRIALERLAKEPAALRQPPASVVLLSWYLGPVEQEELLRAAQQHHPADFWINFGLADALREKGPRDAGQAIGFCRAALALRPQCPAVHSNLGLALQDKGDLDGAIKAYEAALRLKKDFPEAYKIHTNLAVALQVKGDLDGAIKAYKAALRLKKDFPLAHFNLGLALQAKGNPDGAIKEYREALRLQKDYPEAHYNLGNALAAKGKGDLDGAIKAYQEALRLQKDYPEAHCNLGNVLAAKGDPDGAIKAYQEALRLQKDYPEAHCNLGIVLAAKGDPDGAIKAYQEALRLQKDFPVAYNNLGNALQAKGDLQGAIKAYQTALRLKKDFPEAYNNLGNALSDKGDVDGAIAAYQKAFLLKKNFPGAFRAHNNLGLALEAKGDVDGAIKEYREALRLEKDFPLAYNNLGVALCKRGDLDGGIKEYQEALRLKKDFPLAHCNLGHALKAQGQFSEALSALQRGHQLGSKRPGWPYPSAQWVQQCQRLVELDARLQDILDSKKQPADATERIALAGVCHLKRLYRQATRFYEEAFADQPDLASEMKQGHRYNAACAAALAGCGKGKDADVLDAKERAGLRQQALDWLRADLTAWQKQLAKNPDKLRPQVLKTMRHWQQDSDFAGVRGQEALAQLPEAERPEWQTLWQDVEALRKSAAPP